MVGDGSRGKGRTMTQQAEDILKLATEQVYSDVVRSVYSYNTPKQSDLAICILWDARKYLMGQFQQGRGRELMGLYTRQHFAR